MASTTTTKTLLLSYKPPYNHRRNHNTTVPLISPRRHRRMTTLTASALHGGGVGGGGGVSDTRKSEFSREFAVIASMLKRIEPLDSIDISKGVSDSAKDSMKQTISTMLGLIPSYHFHVSLRLSNLPLHRLLVSSIITGYTLWNAEYRVSLMRNFELCSDNVKANNLSEGTDELGVACEANECGDGVASTEVGVDSPKQITSDKMEGLSPEALIYIQQLEAELCSAKQELDAQKKDSEEMELNRGGNYNNLLEYLRSLESYMVIELSQPSSVEVKEVIFELVQNTIRRVFKDDITENTSVGSISEQVFTISRDHLAKLLFWCMMLGHHLRGLENRLHLSCVVGLL